MPNRAFVQDAVRSPGTKIERPYSCWKLVDGTREQYPESMAEFGELFRVWVVCSWFATVEPIIMQRHVESLGGHVRLMRGDLLIDEWFEGEKIQGAAAA